MITNKKKWTLAAGLQQPFSVLPWLSPYAAPEHRQQFPSGNHPGQNADNSNMITVTGTEEVKIVPDMTESPTPFIPESLVLAPVRKPTAGI